MWGEEMRGGVGRGRRGEGVVCRGGMGCLAGLRCALGCIFHSVRLKTNPANVLLHSARRRDVAIAVFLLLLFVYSKGRSSRKKKKRQEKKPSTGWHM